jgi:hypothetical protein
MTTAATTTATMGTTREVFLSFAFGVAFTAVGVVDLPHLWQNLTSFA